MMSDKIASWFFAVLFVAAILLCTPIGGVAKVIIFIGWLIGGAYLAIKILGEVLSIFSAYNDALYWRQLGMMLAVLAVLTIMMIVSDQFFPDPPGTNADINWDGRSNSRW